MTKPLEILLGVEGTGIFSRKKYSVKFPDKTDEKHYDDFLTASTDISNSLCYSAPGNEYELIQTPKFKEHIKSSQELKSTDDIKILNMINNTVIMHNLNSKLTRRLLNKE